MYLKLNYPVKSQLRIRGLILGGAWGAKVQKVPKLSKHSVNQKKTTAIGGGG